MTERRCSVTFSPAHGVGHRAVSLKAKHHVAHEHLSVIVMAHRRVFHLIH